MIKNKYYIGQRVRVIGTDRIFTVDNIFHRIDLREICYSECDLPAFYKESELRTPSREAKDSSVAIHHCYCVWT